MTMSFRVADAKLLDGVAPGDQGALLGRQGGRHYTVTTLQKAN